MIEAVNLRANQKMMAQHYLWILAIALCLLSGSSFLYSQNASRVRAEIDTAQIKIGEQIQYKITVETDSLDLVFFPEDQTFSPLEMVEALKVDTTKRDRRIILKRIYALTQFDSGIYVIPQQHIAINEEPFLTDSFRIAVADVVVDTTKQKLYDIKPLIKVERSYAKTLGWLIKILLALLIIGGIGGLVYWFIFRPKPLSEEEKVALLPPYDRALFHLKELEKSAYLIMGEYKKYYSELTDIVRSYLEEDAHISAMESTTDELINRLELMQDAGELELDDQTLAQFKKVLFTADLVKFAKSQPSASLAEDNRKSMELIVVKTKEALPEPKEEELLEDEEYIVEIERKRKRKRIYITVAIFVGVLALGVGITVVTLGFQEVRDTVFRHPTKRLLEGEWVSSAYGYPPIEIETPEVLKRKEVSELNPLDSIQSMHIFGMTNFKGMFSASVTATTFTNGKPVNFEQSVEEVLKSLQRKGARNLIAKNEEAFTKSGVQGTKVYGSYQMKTRDVDENIRTKYAIFVYGGVGFKQQIILTWLESDPYAEKMIQRITESIDVKTET